MNLSKRHDAKDRLLHTPEARLFASILFDDNPANRIPVLNQVRPSRLSVWGRKLKADLIEMANAGRINNLTIQYCYIGRGYRDRRLKWFFTIIKAAPSTVTYPFNIDEMEEI